MTERAELTWHGGRSIEAKVRGLPVWSDKPPEKGGADKGPMPTELFLTSLASCTMMSTLRVAEVRKVPVEALSATAELDYDDRDRVAEVRLAFHVRSPAPAKDWEVVARMAGKFCTIEQLTEPPIRKRFHLNGEHVIEAEKAA